MPGFIGRRLCPQLVFVKPNFERRYLTFATGREMWVRSALLTPLPKPGIRQSPFPSCLTSPRLPACPLCNMKWAPAIRASSLTKDNNHHSYTYLFVLSYQTAIQVKHAGFRFASALTSVNAVCIFAHEREMLLKS
eukprot:1158188-Pelagomonas_calceolata.AAC.14